jgi:hypothetical protein
MVIGDSDGMVSILINIIIPDDDYYRYLIGIILILTVLRMLKIKSLK